MLFFGEAIAPADLALSSRRGSSGSLDEMTLEEAEQSMIRKALARSAAKVGEAAAALGLMRMPGGIFRAAVDCQSARTAVLRI